SGWSSYGSNLPGSVRWLPSRVVWGATARVGVRWSGGRDGFGLLGALGDLDFAGLGPFRDRDGDHQHAVVVAGVDRVGVEPVAEKELADELSVGAFRGDDL